MAPLFERGRAVRVAPALSNNMDETLLESQRLMNLRSGVTFLEMKPGLAGCEHYCIEEENSCQNTVPEFPSESFSRRIRLSKKMIPRSIRDSYRSVISVSNPCQA